MVSREKLRKVKDRHILEKRAFIQTEVLLMRATFLAFEKSERTRTVPHTSTLVEFSVPVTHSYTEAHL